MGAGCQRATFDPPLGQAQYSVVCGPRLDIELTPDSYVGVQEEPTSTVFDPAHIGHASTVEIAKATTASATVFAAGWIHTNNMVKVSLYDVGVNAITSTITLPYGAHEHYWVARLGYDEVCNAVSESPSCAWLVWNDSYGEISWVAVGPDGSLGDARWLGGLDGSGDVGVFEDPGSGLLRRKLLAYITPDRKQVMTVILDHDGSLLGSPRTLRATQNNFEAHQTAVVWSAREERWLVVWSEQYVAADYAWKGKIVSRWVDHDGFLVQSVATNVAYCGGHPLESRCIGGGVPLTTEKLTTTSDVADLSISSTIEPNEPIKKTDAGADSGGGVRINEPCYCKAFYLAESDYDPWYFHDRYRIHHYDVHVRLDHNGVRAAIYTNSLDNPLDPNCITLCPLAASQLSTPIGTSTFQLAGQNFASQAVEQRRLIVGGRLQVSDEAIHYSPLFNPQASRATEEVTAFLATTDFRSGGERLSITIANTRTGGCP